MMNDKDRRAIEARRLLDEPLLNEALDRIERDAVNEMLRLPFWSDRKRRMLADRVRVVRGMRSHLQSIVLTGTEQRSRSVV